MARLKRSAILLEDDEGSLLFEAADSLDQHPRAHDVDDADLPTLKALASGFGDVDAAVVSRWNKAVPGLVREDSVDDELLTMRAFAADRRFTLEFFSAQEAMNASQDTEAYHQEVIDDADVQFDDVETTLAHLFAFPSAALQGRTFGGSFCDAVVDTSRKSLTVVELGCGTGRFAHDFLDRLKHTRPDVYETVRYTLVDLSPALQESQRRRCAPHGHRCEFVLRDLLQYTGEQLFDVVISNEVIADLPVRACYRDEAKRYASPNEDEALSCVRRYGLNLDGAPHAVLVNTGAIALVERLDQLVAAGGVAIITEYGSRTRAPIRVVLGGHVEHSIHFGHLETVAAGAELLAATRRVADMVGLDEHTDVIDLENLDVLRRAVGPLLGLPPLPRMAFSADDIATWLGSKAASVHNLTFVPVRLHPMRVDLFLALIARRS
ncbi:MAG: SAM-dependent methyltransferase [Deltaproteobacteria bacterium]|nr:SAM-dependent methyltransferase [Deltaproteobacteria bacterium]